MLLAMIEQSVDPTWFGELELHIDSCVNCRKVIAALALGSRPASTPHVPFAELELAVGARIHDRYVVESEIGRGGMGTVYAARDTTLDRAVALKLHRAGSADDRLRREAVAMAQLAHPNVVCVFEVASVDDRLYVAMEYVRGGTLRGWIDAAPRPWREVVAMLGEAGRGLAAAHAAGLVHRDFKPENVLVGEDGRPRVSDFGLARSTRATEATEATGIAGTPAYMAPEQLAGETVDARSDQFAFCVVAWECLFGKRPFAGASLPALITAIEEHALVPPASTIPERVVRVLERGLATDPAARYPDVPALLAALQRAAAPRTRRNVAAGAIALVAIAGAAWPIRAAVVASHVEAACAREQDEVRARFDDGTRGVIQRAFAATGSAFAQASFDHAASVVDRYTASLADQAGAVCRDREQPEHVVAARRLCLTERGSELAGLVDVFAHADREVVVYAPDAAWAMFDPRPCTDAAAVPAMLPTAEQTARLGRVKSLAHAGRMREGVELGTTLLADARAQRNQSLELAVLLALGQLRQKLDVASAPATWHEAEALAEAQGRDLDAAEALDSLANAAGVEQQDYVGAHRQIQLARAKLARIGGNTAVEARLLMTEAQVLMFENRLGEAETASRRGVAMLEQVLGGDHPAVGSAYGLLSEVLRAESKHAEDLAVGKRALAILAQALGDDDPTVAGAQLNLASALIGALQFDEARALLLRADGVFQEAFGPDHPVRTAIYGNLGTLEQNLQHWDAALTDFRIALGIVERTEGPDAPAIAGVERDVATTLMAQGKLDEALAASQRAVAVTEKHGADGETRLGGALGDLAEIQLARGHAELALPIAERSLAMATARPSDANPGELADAQFLVARVLWEGHGDRKRARTLADAAAKAQPDPDRQAAIHTWQLAHL
jgi:eukaryotic-like serine/threonine-protein kinase